MKPLPVLVATAAVIALSSCSTAPAGPDDDRVQVVASTNVYGDLTATIGGDHVAVTSIITSPAQDPHSYEASAQDQLAISRAGLVVLNGGGYDPFMQLLLDAAGTRPATVNAVEASGLLPPATPDAGDGHDDGPGDHDHAAGLNEHVWYDLHAVPAIVDAIAHELAALDPDHAAEFDANARALVAEVDALHARAHVLEHEAGGGRFAATEPVAVHLLTSAGLTDVTPPAFAEAIEEGADVPPAALLSILNLVEGGDLVLLAHNEQTSSPETERVVAAAQRAGVPTASFTETLPEGEHFVSWMAGNLDRIEEALGR